MGNVIIIAKKELGDLFNSRIVLVVVIAFLIELFVSLYSSITLYNHDGVVSIFGLRENALLKSIIGGLACRLVNYGSITGIIIGLCVLSNENYHHAMNTLITKPVYRDTIINGKILGSVLFLAVTMTFITIIYFAAIFYIVGSSVCSLIVPLITSLPFVIFSCMVGASVFMALSLLISNLFKEQSLSVLIVLIVWLLLTQVIPTTDVAWNIALFFGNDIFVQRLIENLSPTFLIQRIFWEIPAYDVIGGIIAHTSELIWLFTYLLITVVSSYIIMLRRDIV